jgi:hypothetical protein
MTVIDFDDLIRLEIGTVTTIPMIRRSSNAAPKLPLNSGPGCSNTELAEPVPPAACH